MSSADANGRWWAFNVTPETLVILEKKTCPQHLQNLGCLDTCTTLQQVLREIQDSGEARLKSHLEANGREQGPKYIIIISLYHYIYQYYLIIISIYRYIIKYIIFIIIIIISLYRYISEEIKQINYSIILEFLSHRSIGMSIYVGVWHPKANNYPC